MTLRCLSYRALDRFRQTKLASKLFYGGQRVTLGDERGIVGIVVRVPSDETDGDCTFDVRSDDGQTTHCEITPCQSPAIRKIACSLQLGWRVYVRGIDRWDPAHLGGPGHRELHPVTTIIVRSR